MTIPGKAVTNSIRVGAGLTPPARREVGSAAIPLPSNRGVDIFGNLWYNHFAQKNSDFSLHFVRFGNPQ